MLSDDNIVLPILTQEKQDLGYRIKTVVTQPKHEPVKSVQYEVTVNLNLKNNLIKQLAQGLLDLNNLQLQSQKLENRLKLKKNQNTNPAEHEVSLRVFCDKNSVQIIGKYFNLELELPSSTIQSDDITKNRNRSRFGVRADESRQGK